LETAEARSPGHIAHFASPSLPYGHPSLADYSIVLRDPLNALQYLSETLAGRQSDGPIGPAALALVIDS
jgi:hypothetical protein